MQANELFTQPNTILLDGGMGTMLQAAGLKLGARPEELNITDPQLIESIHSRYAAAGSRIINANTFGASAHKLAGSEYTLEEIIAAGIANCKRACAPYGALAALDVGPLGELLEPNGTLAFEDAVAEYGRIVRAGVAAGADLVFFETFTDLYELKAALLAAKENCDLPILASMSFEAGGRTFTGCTVESFAVTARANIPTNNSFATMFLYVTIDILKTFPRHSFSVWHNININRHCLCTNFLTKLFYFFIYFLWSYRRNHVSFH